MMVSQSYQNVRIQTETMESWISFLNEGVCAISQHCIPVCPMQHVCACKIQQFTSNAYPDRSSQSFDTNETPYAEVVEILMEHSIKLQSEYQTELQISLNFLLRNSVFFFNSLNIPLEAVQKCQTELNVIMLLLLLLLLLNENGILNS